MFGISEKEYERQVHEQRLKTIDSKALIFNTIALNSTNDLVFIGEYILRKSFIHKVSKGSRSDGQGTFISYFDFQLKGHIDSMTDNIFISESEISFNEIINLLK
ncbi:hypothetical protein [Acinetobacter bereziniae]|uniref:hypothetical protein n=2 Tax=Acinetobacter bereziniae TaxID=106648 RepID=UPI001115F6F1|nr:hypothetical protein [Acinetobacter bereziniae]TNL54219.1 hypothetical protein EYY58_18695 [Acinetobacter bereziniae]